MSDALLFNPRPRIERVALTNGQSCYVIDDALIEPERLRIYAQARHAEFRNVDFNAYPGIYLIAPEGLASALQEFFGAHIRRLFDARRVLDMHCRYSMDTLPPDALRPRQRLCHRDSVNVRSQQSIHAS